jgi:hypothetical protein
MIPVSQCDVGIIRGFQTVHLAVFLTCPPGGINGDIPIPDTNLTHFYDMLEA